MSVYSPVRLYIWLHAKGTARFEQHWAQSAHLSQTITSAVQNQLGAGCIGTAASAGGFDEELRAYRKARGTLRRAHSSCI